MAKLDRVAVPDDDGDVVGKAVLGSWWPEEASLYPVCPV